MWPTFLKYGVAAGLVAGSALLAVSLAYGGQPPPSYGMALGYAAMLVALSAVFVGIKRHRDCAGGGVIRFWPAFGLGLAISLVAGLFYVAAWELAMALIDKDFAALFGRMMVERARAGGATGEALAQAVEQAGRFERMYRNPLYRLPMTFAEIFPVGVLVSLVSAAVLRNPRVLPARG
ncbi:DUF4199 domain-containing protein [Luteimonas sp. RD2P54]|uniref:DUF4199 domain-containing protein n=1 Tax=Luteimonas endophytica TaxID=3042023 RepID=A0ABT6JA20_9GAMM|nr:DUF4199 domain-containing protein [Luteimonas endophytica]MDH5823671.1 DUF4199 domain-containing protein [Luteimonas endophytica]